MMLRFPYPTPARDAMAVLLGACLLPGCVDPKDIGQQTDSSSDDGSDTAEPTTAGSTGPDTAGPTTAEPTTAGSTGSDTEGLCPPMQAAECAQCECVGNTWECDTSSCNYECTGLACGDSCQMCPDDYPDCYEDDFAGVCTADGQCVGTPPPKQGFCEGLLGPGFELELTTSGGCSDMDVYAHDAADTQALVLWISSGLVADAHASGMPVHAELDALDPAVSLEARAGIDVTAEECNDVGVPGVQIDELWLPTSGTVIVDVTPDGAAEGFATVEFVDLVLARQQPGPAPITVPSLVLTDVYVGWLPG